METKESAIATTGEKNDAVALTAKTLADQILVRVSEFSKAGALTLPKDYSVGNAVKFAWLMLQQAVDKDKKPVLQTCRKESIANALLEMCIQGLNPAKKQCYFIAYGGKLEMQRSYQGSMAVAKRVSNCTSIYAQVIYKKDTFEYEIDKTTGRKKVTKHVQKMENIDNNEIIGAYAIATFGDGSSNMEVMNILQIRKAWAQGKGGGNTGAHQNFAEEMSKKSVINRLCKGIINSSDDSSLFKGQNENELEMTDPIEESVIEDIKENANLSEVNLEEVKTEDPHAPESKEEQKEEAVEQLPDDVANNIIIRLSECKNANQVKNVEEFYEEYKGHPHFQLLIAQAKAKFATGEKKVKEKPTKENPW